MKYIIKYKHKIRHVSLKQTSCFSSCTCSTNSHDFFTCSYACNSRWLPAETNFCCFSRLSERSWHSL